MAKQKMHRVQRECYLARHQSLFLWILRCPLFDHPRLLTASRIPVFVQFIEILNHHPQHINRWCNAGGSLNGPTHTASTASRTRALRGLHFPTSSSRSSSNTHRYVLWQCAFIGFLSVRFSSCTYTDGDADLSS